MAEQTTNRRRQGDKQMANDFEALEVKIDGLARSVGELSKDTKETNKQVIANQVIISGMLEKIRGMDGCIATNASDIKSLENKSNIWTGINSVGIIIAGIFGITKS